MGGGDWNDGMNRVGEAGQGESVWLAWLLHTTLTDFARLADARRDAARASVWRDHASALAMSLEEQAWDGDWYRRAWFDDGAVIGSAANTECRIDSIAQSWAVISGAAKPQRAAQAMAAVERELIDEDDGLALLFTPPFDRTPHDPGYIKGYPPGIRENGGQYTHAAAWSVIAFAKLGQGDKAASLVLAAEPDQPRPHAGRASPLQGGALCGRRRHLCRARPPRSRGLDLVHRLGRLDARAVVDILGLRFEGGVLSVNPEGLAGFRDHSNSRSAP